MNRKEALHALSVYLEANEGVDDKLLVITELPSGGIYVHSAVKYPTPAELKLPDATLIIGNDHWAPSADELQEVVELFQRAGDDPEGSVVAFGDHVVTVFVKREGVRLKGKRFKLVPMDDLVIEGV
jgi:hypothetical protein